jgi:hypothetical protein
MTVTGIESITPAIQQPGFFVKCILTDSVAVFFPGSVQHRDVKQLGASYEDNYRGNALAATIAPGRIDVRFHQDYSDERVRRICRELLRSAEMAWAATYSISYQGRPLI